MKEPPKGGSLVDAAGSQSTLPVPSQQQEGDDERDQRQQGAGHDERKQLSARTAAAVLGLGRPPSRTTGTSGSPARWPADWDADWDMVELLSVGSVERAGTDPSPGCAYSMWSGGWRWTRADAGRPFWTVSRW